LCAGSRDSFEVLANRLGSGAPHHLNQGIHAMGIRRALLFASCLSVSASSASGQVWSEATHLFASDGANGDLFGTAVAVQQDTTVVGARGSDRNGVDSGAAYVYERDQGGSGAWGEAAILFSTSANPQDHLGDAVSIWGDTIVAGAGDFSGASGVPTGAAFVFGRDFGGPGAWGEGALLRPADLLANDEFGTALAIAGDTIAAGAGNQGYQYIGDCDGLAFDPVAGTLFGASSASDQLLRIDLELGAATPVGPLGYDQVHALAFDPNAGVLYAAAVNDGVLLTVDTSTGAASEVGPLGYFTVTGLAFDVGTDTLYASDLFSGQLHTVNTTTGAATPVGPLSAAISGLSFDPLTNTLFGIDEDTARLVSIDTTSAALTPIGPAGSSSVDGLALDSGGGVLFGSKSSLYTLDPATGTQTSFGPLTPGRVGAVYLFERDEGGVGAWGQVLKLVPPSSHAGSGLGTSLSISGDTLAAGAPTTASGAVYVYERDLGGPGQWGYATRIVPTDATDQFGGAVALSAGTLAVGAPDDDTLGVHAGAVYLFERDLGGSGNWGQVRKITASDGATLDHFGTSVAFEGDTLVIGAPGDNDAGTNSGSVYVLARDFGGRGAWGELQKLLASDGDALDRFGNAVALSGQTLSAGAVGDDITGSAYVFDESAAPVSYCTAGTSASGCRATLGAAGAPSASAPSGFFLTATDVEGGKRGMFFYAANGRQASPWGNGSSYQCVVPPLRRGGQMDGVGALGTCAGTFALDLNARWCATCPWFTHNPGPGSVAQAQLWYRDPFNTSNRTTGFSDAVEFTVAP
jgi:hypothetical protein